jgi:fermentation-respiration switch protein FrsA (DUF1100 family)
MSVFRCSSISDMRLLLALIMAVVVSGCSSVFFQPQRMQYLTPDEIGLAYEDVYFRNSDGLMLHGWLLAAQGRAKGTVLFLHGNAQNISTHIASVHWLPAQHYNVFLPDYRGYGLSEGEASLAGVQDDINSAMAYLLQRADLDSERIVILGQSLGGALAIYNVAHSPYRQKIKALITESVFSDYEGIVREKLSSFWLTWPLQWPLALTIDNDYSPLTVVGKVSPIPLLIIHGDNDNIVPLSHGQTLFAAAAQPREMWVVPNGGHIEAFRHKEYQARLLEYLERVLPQK